MRRFGDITNVWSTVKEVNVGEIRESAEQPVRIAVIGAPELRTAVIQALYAGPTRYPSSQRAGIAEFDVPLPRDRQTEVGRVDLALFVVDVRAGLDDNISSTADKLSMLALPRIAVLVGAEQSAGADGQGLWYLAGMTPAGVPDTRAETLQRHLMPHVVDQLPDDLRIAAARKLPGLRDHVARWLIGDVSFTNATYALTSGLPEMVPLLTIPLNAADIMVLSKNQALLVYKLSLAYGAPPDFQTQMKEVLPVIGGSFLWRQLARQLVGLIPGFGLVPKVAVAYAGTYATGQAAAIWYRTGEELSREALRRLYLQAMQVGRQRAADLLRRRTKPTEDAKALEDEAAAPLAELPGPTEEPGVEPRRRWWDRFRR